MANQTIVKPLGLIRDLKIFFHGISYTVTFIVINSSVVNSSYSMLLGHPWLKDVKVSHDWGTNIITKQLGTQTKRPEVLVFMYIYNIKTQL
jgi:hypothetical protein